MQPDSNMHESVFDVLDVHGLKKTERYLVIAPESGFGNRISAVAGAYALAKLTRRRLLLQWNATPNELPAEWSNLFQSPDIVSASSLGIDDPYEWSFLFLQQVKYDHSHLLNTQFPTIIKTEGIYYYYDGTGRPAVAIVAGSKTAMDVQIKKVQRQSTRKVCYFPGGVILRANRIISIIVKYCAGKLPQLHSDFSISVYAYLEYEEKREKPLKPDDTDNIFYVDSTKKDRILEDTADIIFIKDYTALIPRSIPFGKYKDYYLEFHQRLKPRQDIADNVANFIAANFINRNIVGVHYRSWAANVGDKDWNLEVTPTELFFREMENAVCENENTVFYVATDCLENLIKFEEQFPGKIFHFPVHNVERQTIHGQKCALVDWYLLQNTSYIIGTRQSTFSDEAAIFTKQHKKTELGPYAFAKNGNSKWEKFIHLLNKHATEPSV